MKIYKENDIVILTKKVGGDVIGERRQMILPVGTVATIVLVHGDPEHPKAYEIEAHIRDQDCYVLATVEASDI